MAVKTILLSFWRNDASRELLARTTHLLAKTDVWRWVWVIGDSTDDTEALLHAVAASRPGKVEILACDTGILGEDIVTRRQRIGATENLAYAMLGEARFMDADIIIQHESDLRTDVDVVAQLARRITPETAWAGWPTLAFPQGGQCFYDVWGFRTLDGEHFLGQLPFAPNYSADTPFEVGAFGSVWGASARHWRGRRINHDCCVDLCQQWRAEGVRCFVDPSIKVIQPHSLWDEPVLPVKVKRV